MTPVSSSVYRRRQPSARSLRAHPHLHRCSCSRSVVSSLSLKDRDGTWFKAAHEPPTTRHNCPVGIVVASGPFERRLPFCSIQSRYQSPSEAALLQQVVSRAVVELLQPSRFDVEHPCRRADPRDIDLKIGILKQRQYRRAWPRSLDESPGREIEDTGKKRRSRLRMSSSRPGKQLATASSRRVTTGFPANQVGRTGGQIARKNLICPLRCNFLCVFVLLPRRSPAVFVASPCVSVLGFRGFEL